MQEKSGLERVKEVFKGQLQAIKYVVDGNFRKLPLVDYLFSIIVNSRLTPEYGLELPADNKFARDFKLATINSFLVAVVNSPFILDAESVAAESVPFVHFTAI